jgi:DNA-binding transcriptional MerR regulator
VGQKAEGAFRTIGEVSTELNVPQHILRYWETRFPQLRPLQRAGNRRYYRPADVALVQRIDRLLNHEGYTVRGVQQLLERDEPASAPSAPVVEQAANIPAIGVQLEALVSIRDGLARALADDSRAAL